MHVHGPIRLVRAFAPGMIERGFGRIVNVSSNWGSFADGLGGPPAYSMTKAALNAATVLMARELPNSIKVNAICPGWVQTRMGGAGADRRPSDAAEDIVALATLPAEGPSGQFFREGQPFPW